MQTDSDTTVQDLKNKIKHFCEERDWDQFHNAKELAIGIVTEASELLEHFRFKTPEQTNRLFDSKEKKQELEEELSDVFYFVLRLAQMNNIDLSEAMNAKMQKNAQKYPVQKAKGSNKKYTEF